jgi:type IV secretion system protein VirB9
MIAHLRPRVMISVACGVLVLGVGSVTSVAEVVPGTGGPDSRIRVADYDPGQVYVLRGRVGYQIDLQFDPEESFVGLAAGDIEGLTFVAHGNHLFLKPRAAGVVTNLTVLTSRHQYQFDYSAKSSANVPLGPTMYVVRFRYPNSAQAATAARNADRDLQQHLDDASEKRAHNTDY